MQSFPTDESRGKDQPADCRSSRYTYTTSSRGDLDEDLNLLKQATSVAMRRAVDEAGRRAEGAARLEYALHHLRMPSAGPGD